MEYSEGLKEDGLVRFIDSLERAWLIPLKDLNGGTGGERYIIDLVDMYPVYADAGAYYPDRFDRVLDEYLDSIKPKPELPTEIGAMIRVTETRGNKPRGVYMRQDQDTVPWRSINDGIGWLRDDQIVAWNTVKIVDEEK